jgi:2-keto-4-pentenoate hydratase
VAGQTKGKIISSRLVTAVITSQIANICWGQLSEATVTSLVMGPMTYSVSDWLSLERTAVSRTTSGHGGYEAHESTQAACNTHPSMAVVIVIHLSAGWTAAWQQLVGTWVKYGSIILLGERTDPCKPLASLQMFIFPTASKLYLWAQ